MKVSTNLLKDILHHYTDRLRTIYPEEEAKQLMWLLVEDLFSYSRQQLALHPDIRLSESEMLEVHFAVKDLLKHKPVQYVLGSAYFYGRAFYVNEHVLIPRPETEMLVAEALKLLSVRKSKHMLELGTGSGNIAISIALEQPDASVLAVDISEKALVVAQKNAEMHKARLEFLQADMLKPKVLAFDTSFDVIVSNPPYVRNSEKAFMRQNVLDWEPEDALFVSDEDPLKYYRAIAEIAGLHLQEDGLLLVELNEALGKETADLMKQYGFEDVQIKQDIHLKVRLLIARRSRSN